MKPSSWIKQRAVKINEFPDAHSYCFAIMQYLDERDRFVREDPLVASVMIKLRASKDLDLLH